MRGFEVRNQLKQIYRIAILIPGARAALAPIVRRARHSNFNFDKATSLEIRVIFLESVIAGLEERLSDLEERK
jgi:hypothetical protein